MPNHIHLWLKQIKKDGITKFMSKFGTGYAGYFNKKYDRKGHLFQGKFKAVHVKTNRQLQNLPPTLVETVIRAREIALEEGLKYVYTGNIVYPQGESTYCPESGEVAIGRKGYFITSNNLQNGQCPTGEQIPGIWK